ncbi:MAG: UDP-N-acetylmuramoyl-L-alanyl-D-glutamate--2,6-diaminopimelate ligase [Methylotenera sp. 24-45-7]|jgi:UDP-N-acetylmuramyl-tripeptide synthetase|nr:MAG: UDP-N-acetylmuramoyl-L-alanyl-D-glutamate--2,6-diaminopimelate ligase [Mehylophilales bacterium 35-46-6]OYY84615.1 MAG: UDP-N-acetylmuramoyl-L-alanyl-D-glutamate--2,6-diaminopimelate ligase [Methylophilales bacterium 16-45-9]OYZ41358.1 MAG: UDP-N-acetylmuramoyl-L-alanyl-D-glutamate--2,6-diaminopimelate ligase [Methylotenera sp. 24-45-7]OZA09318.1 MAG: UDP-N-acetylmuramoyl-L-alanyl-D-glutamate--2,6-diaminopimelate ligase [Methylotenera sp. 17-45-7]HQS43645.1 UDP-N-acetylmuramoyl-L-alanyl
MSLLTSFNLTFTAITTDSRKVVSGALFLAYPGTHSDGRHYIAQAIAAGAAAVVWDSNDFAWPADWQVPNIGVVGLKEQVAEIAAEYYGHPTQKITMLGVTGTNGKTSVSQWLAQALTNLGQKTAVIGTIGNGFVDSQIAASNTTPDAVLLQQMLAGFVTQNAKAVAMEVSSHGLHQGRVNAVKFDVAVLTNLSRDHLDYHQTMEEYAAAKAQLFSWPSLRAAVVNADDAFGLSLLEKLQTQAKPVLTYGLHAGDVRGADLQLLQHGLRMQVSTPQGDAILFAPVLGRFNAYNVLAVLSTLLALEISLTDAVAALANIKPVAGRMQQFGGDDKPLVVVDYAHTPDALDKVLATLREQVQGENQLICVFGCGGDRDAGKRPLMGEVAAKLADRVIVTSDNPRSEDPAQIIAQIEVGMHKPHLTELDRAAAIQRAISEARAGDIVLLAGKGHEDYQEIQGLRTPFSDAAVAMAALNAKPVVSGVRP